MIRVRQVKVNIDDNSLGNIKKCTSKKLNIKDENIRRLIVNNYIIIYKINDIFRTSLYSTYFS